MVKLKVLSVEGFGGLCILVELRILRRGEVRGMYVFVVWEIWRREWMRWK